MKLHEYQAKQLFAAANLNTPRGIVVKKVSHIDEAVRSLKPPMMIKAQIHAGGRGKVGAIKKADTLVQAKTLAAEMFGKEIKTKQTGDQTLKVRSLLLEECVGFTAELYIAILTDRANSRTMIIA